MGSHSGSWENDMAGLTLTVNSGEIASGTSRKTILQIKAPANQRLLVKSIEFQGKGSLVADSQMLCRISRNSANFGTGTSATPVKRNPSNPETIQSTAAYNFTAEPTSPTTYKEFELHPMATKQFTEPIEVPGGQSLQVDVTSSVSQTVLASICYEE